MSCPVSLAKITRKSAAVRLRIGCSIAGSGDNRQKAQGGRPATGTSKMAKSRRRNETRRASSQVSLPPTQAELGISKTPHFGMVPTQVPQKKLDPKILGPVQRPFRHGFY